MVQTLQSPLQANTGSQKQTTKTSNNSMQQWTCWKYLFLSWNPCQWSPGHGITTSQQTYQKDRATALSVERIRDYNVGVACSNWKMSFRFALLPWDPAFKRCMIFERRYESLNFIQMCVWKKFWQNSKSKIKMQMFVQHAKDLCFFTPPNSQLSRQTQGEKP